MIINNSSLKFNIDKTNKYIYLNNLTLYCIMISVFENITILFNLKKRR